MGSMMLNQPTQQAQDLNNYMRQTINAARNGNVQQLVQMKLQQNPQLAQAYQNLMQQYPNMTPTQVCEMMTKQCGIDINQFFRR